MNPLASILLNSEIKIRRILKKSVGSLIKMLGNIQEKAYSGQ